MYNVWRHEQRRLLLQGVADELNDGDAEEENEVDDETLDEDDDVEDEFEWPSSELGGRAAFFRDPSFVKL